MDSLFAMIWIELRKATRSRMPLWTGLGSFFMPLGIAFLIFVAKNPAISHQLGLVSAKADLIKYSATDWPAYLALCGQMMAAGGFFLSILILSWVFGREFADGTLKDMLAVPVQRASILLAKFIVAALWSGAVALAIAILSVVMGVILHLPGGSVGVLLGGSVTVWITACLTIVVVMPFALLASIGRGYLLPLGLAILTLILTNIVALIGWGEYFPWAVAGLYAQGTGRLPPVSFGLVFLTGMAGMLGTYFWWKYADQNR